MATLLRRFSQADKNKTSKVGATTTTKDPATTDSNMELQNHESMAQPTSESFWEVGKYARTVNRIDNGYKLCSSLRNLIKERSEIEKGYARQLTAWAKKWNDFLDKGPEYGTTQGAWRGVLDEAEALAKIHVDVGDKLMNEVFVSIKGWQKENYHKSMMHFKETKEMEDSFKKAQKPWEKKYSKVQQAKKDYHNACRQEKSIANQENNARGDSSFSPDQLRKLQEKLKKCQSDVESTNDKYQACLTDLNASNPKYVEDMTEVFTKCQDFEQKRIEFIKKTMFEIHQCLDLSVQSRFSQVYRDLHETISNTDSDKDLLWWSSNHGADMAMNWPVFEKYSPELQSISRKEKKGSQITSGGDGGITITSIRQAKDEPYVYPSQPAQQPAPPVSTQPTESSTNNIDRQDSYDESLNPFGGDNETEGENEIENAEISKNKNAPVSSSSSNNPFGDGDWDDDQASQGSGTGSARKSPEPPAETPAQKSVPCRVLYNYEKDDHDELSADAGDIITRISDEDELGWVKAIRNGQEGLLPASYLEDI